MHAAREDELIALAGELEMELTRMAGQLQTAAGQLAENEHRMAAQQSQIASLKKQLRLLGGTEEPEATAAPAASTLGLQRRNSGHYGFSPALAERPSRGRNIMWAPSEAQNQSTMSAPAVPFARASETRRIARRLNHPQRRGLLHRMRNVFRRGGKEN